MNKQEKNAKDNQKPFDPKMQFDAFMGGVKDGGLRSVSSINMVVCYIVANLNGKVTAQTIVEAMAEGEIANHFEVIEAISRLRNSGVIKEQTDSSLILCKGNNEVDLIEKDLPLTVRDRSIKLCQKIIARECYKRENRVSIEKADNGYRVILKVSDSDIDFMNLTLYAPTEEQAELIKAKFITNPIQVYETLIDSIFENEY